MNPLSVALEEVLFAVFRPLYSVRQATFVAYEPCQLSSNDDEPGDYYTVTYTERPRLISPAFNLSSLEEDLVAAMGQALALASLVSTSEGPRHLFLVDFSCAARSECLASSIEAIEKCVRALGQKDGILVQTQNAFHFYGTGPLLLKAQWERLFLKMRKFSIIESGYLNLSVRRGFSALRLTARPGQMQDVPRVIGTIGTVNIPQQ
ncbi:MAG: hypothetical protein Q8R13_04510, partial [bacterium]|nr:hypothetical protein [bacterium]